MNFHQNTRYSPSRNKTKPCFLCPTYPAVKLGSEFRKALKTMRKSAKKLIHACAINSKRSKFSHRYSITATHSPSSPSSYTRLYHSPSVQPSSQSPASPSQTSSRSSRSSPYPNTRKSRHTSHYLPRLSSLGLFYSGYPNEDLIAEATSLIQRIENGETVSFSEKERVRNKLCDEICRRATPGTANFMTWQVLLDLWKRIPE